jgi:hypothetical protein
MATLVPQDIGLGVAPQLQVNHSSPRDDTSNGVPPERSFGHQTQITEDYKASLEAHIRSYHDMIMQWLSGLIVVGCMAKCILFEHFMAESQ